MCSLSVLVAWEQDHQRCQVGDSLALQAVGAGSDRAARTALIDAGTVLKELGVGAPRAHWSVGAVVTACTVVTADGPGALAGGAVIVDPIRASERGPALAAVVPWGVLDQPCAIAAIVAPVVGLQELATQAPGAVLAVLTSAELAELAGRWGVLICCTLATVVNIGADDPAVLAGKGTEAPPLEVPDAQRGHRVRASLYALAVEQEPSVTTDTAGVTGNDAVAVMAVLVEAATAFTGHGARLNATGAATNRLDAAAADTKTVVVAAGAASVRPAGAATAFRSATVARAPSGGGLSGFSGRSGFGGSRVGRAGLGASREHTVVQHGTESAWNATLEAVAV